MERDVHPAHVRITHWINAIVLLVMLWSGFAMFSGDRHFAWVVRWLPAAFWHALHFAGTKRELFTWHVYAGTFFGINGVAYVASLMLTGAWKRVVPRVASWAHNRQRPLEYSVPQRLAYTAFLVGH